MSRVEVEIKFYGSEELALWLINLAEAHGDQWQNVARQILEDVRRDDEAAHEPVILQ